VAADQGAARSGLDADFWRFWTGQVISALGTSFTEFAIPLLVYKLTHSAVNLALALVAGTLPFLLFGLVIGAWVDRLDRKRLMIAVDLGLALVIGSIPLVAALHYLTVWWVYAASFVGTTLYIFFSSAEFAAIPSLVGQDDLVTANGRIQASYYAASVLGPLLAGALVAFVAVPDLLLADATSYLVSAAALLLIGRSFNAAPAAERKPSSIRQDVVEGLRYVLKHPVLRNISAMMCLFNFVDITVMAQLVLFSKQHLHATNPEIGVLFSAGGLGAAAVSVVAGRVRKRFSFSQAALGCLALSGLLTVAFAAAPWFWLAVPLWALSLGAASLLNINTFSLRQAIVPNEMLGRVISIAAVLASAATPLGALLGGLVIQQTHAVALVYAIIGALMFLIPVAFSFTALGHADRYIPAAEAGTQPRPA
jgi:MFS family permease